jgi:hypothetical protein
MGFKGLNPEVAIEFVFIGSKFGVPDPPEVPDPDVPGGALFDGPPVIWLELLPCDVLADPLFGCDDPKFPLPWPVEAPLALPKDDAEFVAVPNEDAGFVPEADVPLPVEVDEPPDDPPAGALPALAPPNAPPVGVFWEACMFIPLAKDGAEPPVPGPEFAALGSYFAPVLTTLLGS